jgi:hypothetical protein
VLLSINVGVALNDRKTPRSFSYSWSKQYMSVYSKPNVTKEVFGVEVSFGELSLRDYLRLKTVSYSIALGSGIAAVKLWDWP